MKLLIITQKVNRDDPILGFFHRWIEEFAKHVEQLTVICLEEGPHELPSNVRVLSLGKEKGVGRLGRLWRLYTYIWQYRNEYERVFVHMNQEYIVLAGLYWKCLRKTISLWRNHQQGNFLTIIAMYLCDNVFCTSKDSFTAKSKKNHIMPVGIDTTLFSFSDAVRAKKDVVCVGRVDPIKNTHVLVDVARQLPIHLTLIGSPSKLNSEYFLQLKQRSFKNIVFLGSISNRETVGYYQKSFITVNLSPNGLFDKVMFEAMACGSLVISTNRNLKGILPDEVLVHADVQSVSEAIQFLQSKPDTFLDEIRQTAYTYVIENHSLALLGQKLIMILNANTR